MKISAQVYIYLRVCTPDALCWLVIFAAEAVANRFLNERAYTHIIIRES